MHAPISAMGIGSVRGWLFGEGAPSCFSLSGLDFVLVAVHGGASSLPLRSCGGVIAGFVEKLRPVQPELYPKQIGTYQEAFNAYTLLLDFATPEVAGNHSTSVVPLLLLHNIVWLY